MLVHTGAYKDNFRVCYQYIYLKMYFIYLFFVMEVALLKRESALNHVGSVDFTDVAFWNSPRNMKNQPALWLLLVWLMFNLCVLTIYWVQFLFLFCSCCSFRTPQVTRLHCRNQLGLQQQRSFHTLSVNQSGTTWLTIDVVKTDWS